jgi:DNA-binding MarR family transcriptional regulator
VVAGGTIGNSQLKVFKYISKSGISQNQLIRLTRLSPRTVKYSVKTLIARRLISESYLLSDLRRKIYYKGDCHGR